jgi:hypothetical protein
MMRAFSPSSPLLISSDSVRTFLNNGSFAEFASLPTRISAANASDAPTLHDWNPVTAEERAEMLHSLSDFRQGKVTILTASLSDQEFLSQLYGDDVTE